MNWFSKFLQSGLSSTRTDLPKTFQELAIETRSHDGFLREHAIFELARRANADALPVLLERLNDWVPEVRSAARGAVASFMTGLYIDAWIASLPAIVALERATRANHAELLLRAKTLLATKETVTALKLAHSQANPVIKRFIFNLELTVPLSDEERKANFIMALRGNDMVVAMAALDFNSTLSPECQQDVWMEALDSTFGAVRLRALRKVMELNLPTTPNLVRKHCLDAHAGVRSFACAHLRADREAVIEQARLLWASSTSSRFRAAALDTLCILAVPDAQQLCAAARTASAGLIRRMAFDWSFRLASAGARDSLVVLALQDVSAGIRRMAIKNMASGASVPNCEQLLSILSGNPRSLGTLSSVATRLSPWTRLIFLLEARLRMADDIDAAKEISEALSRWEADIGHCYMRPTPDESQTLASLWLDVQTHLEAVLRTRVVYQLTAFHINVA